jgi:predicted CopG family antitoxin
MTTTIQIKEETKKKLNSMKLHPRETYEEVIERMIEDLTDMLSSLKLGGFLLIYT